MNTFHLIIRWGLGIHGTIHIVEFVLNLAEHAGLLCIAGALMLSGALIDYQHHQGHEE